MDVAEVDLRASAIGTAPLFQTWPAPALLRLAKASSIATSLKTASCSGGTGA